MAVSAANLPFGTTDGFETGTPGTGTQPNEFYDSDTGYVGEVTIENSASTGGTVSPGAAGGSQFARIRPGVNGSYQAGSRNGPYGDIGDSTAGNPFSIFVDIYTQATSIAESGSFWWTNAVGDLVGGYLTESGFAITPGTATWGFTTTAGGNPVVNLAANTWYTLEVVFDDSGTEVSATHNIYAQGDRGGTALYSHEIPDGSMFNDPLSSNLGGPAYSWFTVWDDNTVDEIYIDNIGTDDLAADSAVPEPASLTLLGLGAAGLGLTKFRRRKKTA